MTLRRARLRQLHASLAPIMVLPLLLTLITGMLFQLVRSMGQAADFIWLLEVHRGKFGVVNLEQIYPFLNGLGLLTLVVTGASMWWQTRRRRSRL